MQSQMSNKVLRQPFHFYSSFGLTSGAASINISPATFPRVLTIADGFALYRCVELEFRLVPNGNTDSEVAGYIPGGVDTPPTTVLQVSEILNSVVLSADATKPSQWAKLRWNQLRGYMEWYKTIVGTLDPTEEIQGAIFVAGFPASAGPVWLEFRGVFEFKNPVPTASTPMMREAFLVKEKQRLLKLLSYSPPTKDDEAPASPPVNPLLPSSSITASKKGKGGSGPVVRE